MFRILEETCHLNNDENKKMEFFLDGKLKTGMGGSFHRNTQ